MSASDPKRTFANGYGSRSDRNCSHTGPPKTEALTAQRVTMCAKRQGGLRSLAAFVVGLPQVAGFQEPAARLPIALAAKLIASASRAALKMKESRP